MESELFGHEKGAFTGAVARRPGKFTLATQGTLFLDEITNCPYSMQAKLLRVLQEHQFYSVGGTEPLGVDVRVLAASNVPLAERVVSGQFRSDLFHRLNEFELHIPALRERRSDILYLSERFLVSTNQELGKSVSGFTESARQALCGWSWPGNVRELRNVVRRAVLVARDQVERADLAISDEPSAAVLPRYVEADQTLDGSKSLWDMVHETTVEIERAILVKALRQTHGNKAKAARLLKIDYKTMHTKTRLYGISAGEETP